MFVATRTGGIRVEYCDSGGGCGLLTKCSHSSVFNSSVVIGLELAETWYYQ